MEQQEEEKKFLATVYIQGNFCKRRKLERVFGISRTWRILESLKKKKLVECDDGFLSISQEGLKVLKVK